MDKKEIDVVGLNGLNARAHAAILLRVPESGDPDLDAMIRTAQRRDLAAQVLAGMIASEADGCAYSREKISNEAMEVADRLLSTLSHPVAEKEST